MRSSWVQSQAGGSAWLSCPFGRALSSTEANLRIFRHAKRPTKSKERANAKTHLTHLRVKVNQRSVAFPFPTRKRNVLLVVVEKREPVSAAPLVALCQALVPTVVEAVDRGPGEGALGLEIHPPEREVVEVCGATESGSRITQTSVVRSLNIQAAY